MGGVGGQVTLIVGSWRVLRSRKKHAHNFQGGGIGNGWGEGRGAGKGGPADRGWMLLSGDSVFGSEYIAAIVT